MAVEVVFPLLGLSTEGGHIIEWLKSEGDEVEKGDVLAEIETAKVVTELESPASGILRTILVPEGVEIPTFTVIAVITAIDEELPEKYLAEKPLAEAVPTGPVSEETVEKPLELGKQQPHRKVIAVPLVRKLASEYGVDLSLLSGTGPGGRIVKKDVLQAAQEGKIRAVQPAQEEPGLAEEELAPLSSMRKVIARRMTESFQSPHFYLTVEVDTQKLRETREQLIPLIENKVGIGLTYTDLITKMTAQALEDNPSVNCTYADGSVKLFRRIDIGLVVAVEGGLIVPIIRQANKKSLADIAQARAELAQKARERKLSMEEMRGSTFTISNMGMFEVDQFSAILQPPEAAILAMGRIADKAVVRNGEVVIRPMMTLTLSIDHRVLDGAMGANFLRSLKNYIENPANLLL